MKIAIETKIPIRQIQKCWNGAHVTAIYVRT